MTTPPSRNAAVQGTCPACGSRGLFVGSGGYVTCSWIECPNPVAPSEALGVEFPARRPAEVPRPGGGSA